MREYGTAKVSDLKPSKDHIRQTLGSDDELRALGHDFLKRPIHSLILQTQFANQIVDGHRRWRGVMLIDPDAEVPVCHTDEVVNEAVKLEIMIESAIHTRSLSVYEEFVGCMRWLEINAGTKAEVLAARIGRTPAMLSKILSLKRTIRPIQEAAQAGLIGVAEWSEFAKGDERLQHEMWAARSAGLLKGRDNVARVIKSARSAHVSAVKANRIRLVLSSGVTVTIAGHELTLDAAIEAAAESRKEMLKGRDQGLDSRTIAKVLEQRAKAAS